MNWENSKVAILVGRCELKDLIDLYFLRERGFDAVELLPDAQRKEGGLEPAMVSYILAATKIDDIPEYLIASLDVDDLRRFVSELQTRMSELAFPE